MLCLARDDHGVVHPDKTGKVSQFCSVDRQPCGLSQHGASGPPDSKKDEHDAADKDGAVHAAKSPIGCSIHASSAENVPTHTHDCNDRDVRTTLFRAIEAYKFPRHALFARFVVFSRSFSLG